MDRELRIAENKPPTESDTGGIRGKDDKPEQMQIVDSTSTPFPFTAPKGKAISTLSHVVTPLNPTFNPKGLPSFSSYGGDFTVEKLGPPPSSPHHELFYYSPVWNSATLATVPLSSTKVVPTQKIDKARVLHWKTQDRAADYDQQCKVMGMLRPGSGLLSLRRDRVALRHRPGKRKGLGVAAPGCIQHGRH